MSPLTKAPGRGRRFLNVLLAAFLTAVVTLLMAYGLSSLSNQNELAGRVDRNASISRRGVSSIVCILSVPPEDRTNLAIQNCLELNGYTELVELP